MQTRGAKRDMRRECVNVVRKVVDAVGGATSKRNELRRRPVWELASLLGRSCCDIAWACEHRLAPNFWRVVGLQCILNAHMRTNLPALETKHIFG